jgi:hypothetical protein
MSADKPSHNICLALGAKVPRSFCSAGGGCKGFRAPAGTNASTRTAAGVRKPPRDETGGRARNGRCRAVSYGDLAAAGPDLNSAERPGERWRWRFSSGLAKLRGAEVRCVRRRKRLGEQPRSVAKIKSNVACTIQKTSRSASVSTPGRRAWRSGNSRFGRAFYFWRKNRKGRRTP